MRSRKGARATRRARSRGDNNRRALTGAIECPFGPGCPPTAPAEGQLRLSRHPLGRVRPPEGVQGGTPSAGGTAPIEARPRAGALLAPSRHRPG
eukprot:scaffold479_cov376-Prasinococcus_capsulatus_cf.AAC.8